jgi:ketosteroid isomerase-like protein
VVQRIGAIREALAGILAMKPHIDLQTVSVLQGASNLALLAGRWTLRGTAGDGSAVESAGDRFSSPAA